MDREPLYTGENPFKLEEIGRYLAFNREGSIGEPLPEAREWDDVKFLDNVERFLYNINVTIENAQRAELISEEKSEKLRYFIYALEDACFKLKKFVSKNIGKERGGVEADPEIIESLELVDSHSKKLFGKRCTWLLHQTDHYMYSAAVNDFTACYHRLLEAINNLFGERRDDIRSTFGFDATDFEKSVCEAWNRGYEILKYYYDDEDVDAPWCYAVKNRVWIRLGSAAGHAMSINLETGKLDYYDTDSDVNRTMALLWSQHADLQCEVEPDGVTCTGATGVRAKLAAAIAAAATSMDFRLREPERYWGSEWFNALTERVLKILKEERVL